MREAPRHWELYCMYQADHKQVVDSWSASCHNIGEFPGENQHLGPSVHHDSRTTSARGMEIPADIARAPRQVLPCALTLVRSRPSDQRWRYLSTPIAVLSVQSASAPPPKRTASIISDTLRTSTVKCQRHRKTRPRPRLLSTMISLGSEPRFPFRGSCCFVPLGGSRPRQTTRLSKSCPELEATPAAPIASYYSLRLLMACAS